MGMLFVIACIFCFYLPGKILLHRLRLELSFSHELFMATTIGMLVFLSIAYITGWLGNSLLVFVLLLAAVDLWSITSGNFFPRRPQHHEYLPLIIISLCAFFISATMFSSGVSGSTAHLFGVNSGDGLWHIELIHELQAHFPPDNPGFSQVPLKGYHFFYNLILARVATLFALPVDRVLFTHMPLLIAWLWALGTYTLIEAWTKSRSAGLWAVFLSLFGGSFAFLLLITGHSVNIDSAFGVLQAPTSLVNPPYACSLVMLVAGLYSLHQYLRTLHKSWLVPLVLCVGLVWMIKIYAGIILTVGLGIGALIRLFHRKKDLIIPLLAAGGIVVLTYGIFSEKGAGFIWSPFWVLPKVMEDNLPWYGFQEKLETYSRLSVVKGLTSIYFDAAVAFFLGNLGTRLIGLLAITYAIIRKRHQPTLFGFLLLMMLVFSLAMPVLFLQTGQVYEIIQFAWYSLFFCALFAGIGFDQLVHSLKNPLFQKILQVLLIVGTLPSAFYAYTTYVSPFFIKTVPYDPSGFAVSNFLSQEKDYDETVVELPPRDVALTPETLEDWYRKDKPSLIAFANKRGYASFENHTFANVALDKRLTVVGNLTRFSRGILASSSDIAIDVSLLKKTLHENNIEYIVSRTKAPTFTQFLPMEEVFSNNTYYVYKLKER